MIKVGQKAPDFGLEATTGGKFTLSDYRGKKNVLIVFFPLAFTPVWSNELSKLEKEFSRFEQLDAQVVGISVDSLPSQKAFAAQLGLKSYPLASDFKKEVAKAYDVLTAEGYTERATVIVDKNGTVRWTEEVPVDQQRDMNRWLDELRTLKGTLRQ